jgi:hypothetical protein
MYNKKQAWGMLSNKLKEHNILKSSAKCDEKWRNLKKNYDKVVSENKKTGNNKHTWKFFKELHDIYFKNPKYHPQFTISSTPYNQTTQRNSAESPHCSIKNIGSTDDGVFNAKPDKESCILHEESVPKQLCCTKKKNYNFVRNRTQQTKTPRGKNAAKKNYVRVVPAKFQERRMTFLLFSSCSDVQNVLCSYQVFFNKNV